MHYYKERLVLNDNFANHISYEFRYDGLLLHEMGGTTLIDISGVYRTEVSLFLFPS
jgi:hypothetical protein